MKMFRSVSAFVMIFFMLGVNFLGAEERLQAASLEDQWGKKQSLDYNAQWFIFAADKTSGTWVKESLLALKVTDLAEHNLVYVADVSGMPSLILRFIGVPRLQELPFRVLLDREGGVSKKWPRKEDQVTIFLSQKGEIKEVRFFDHRESLEGFLRSKIRVPSLK